MNRLLSWMKSFEGFSGTPIDPIPQDLFSDHECLVAPQAVQSGVLPHVSDLLFQRKGDDY